MHRSLCHFHPLGFSPMSSYYYTWLQGRLLTTSDSMLKSKRKRGTSELIDVAKIRDPSSLSWLKGTCWRINHGGVSLGNQVSQSWYHANSCTRLLKKSTPVFTEDIGQNSNGTGWQIREQIFTEIWIDECLCTVSWVISLYYLKRPILRDTD